MVAVALVLMIIEQVCPVGTDRFEELANCWFNIKWGNQ